MKCRVCGKEIRAAMPVCRECLPEGWISVKDRLPEEVERDEDVGWSARVLVATPKGVGLSQYCFDGEESEWCDVDRVDGMGRIDGTITHWMPLPAPPVQNDDSV